MKLKFSAIQVGVWKSRKKMGKYFWAIITFLILIWSSERTIQGSRANFKFFVFLGFLSDESSVLGVKWVVWIVEFLS